MSGKRGDASHTTPSPPVNPLPLPRRSDTPSAKAARAVFFERHAYRRRRMADAARLLPILGAGVFLMPLLWPGEGAGAARTTDVMLYVFGTWAMLIGLAALVSRDLGRDRSGGPDGPDGPDDAGGTVGTGGADDPEGAPGGADATAGRTAGPTAPPAVPLPGHDGT